MSANNNANKYKTTNIFLSLEGINNYFDTLFSCRIGENFELPMAVTGYILKVLVQGFQIVVGIVHPQNKQIIQKILTLRRRQNSFCQGNLIISIPTQNTIMINEDSFDASQNQVRIVNSGF